MKNDKLIRSLTVIIQKNGDERKNIKYRNGEHRCCCAFLIYIFVHIPKINFVYKSVMEKK